MKQPTRQKIRATLRRQEFKVSHQEDRRKVLDTGHPDEWSEDDPQRPVVIDPAPDMRRKNMKPLIKEHDVVVLAVDLPEYGLKAGARGTVVHICAGGAAYVVEFGGAADFSDVQIVTLTVEQVTLKGA